ncbi:MAG: hypothetical protein DRI70_05805, partial [Bacteroidetes bacterium]
MSRKNLQHISLEKREARMSVRSGTVAESVKHEAKKITTAEDIDVKSNYSEKDIEKLHHLD